MPDEHDRPRLARGQMAFDKIGVLGRIPVRGRRGRLAEAGKIDQVDEGAILKQRGDAPKTLSIGAPSMQENDVAAGRRSEDLIDERGAAVLEMLDAIDAVWHGLGRSVSRAFRAAAQRGAKKNQQRSTRESRRS